MAPKAGPHANVQSYCGARKSRPSDLHDQARKTPLSPPATSPAPATSADGPSFVARWDQGPQQLDIDMHGASPSAVRKFKSNRDGYSGHRTSRTADPDKRVFDIQIQMPPLGTIFDGIVSFANHHVMPV